MPSGEIKLGIRPEYVELVAADSPGALPATVSQLQDVGTHVILSANLSGHKLKARLSSDLAHLSAGDNVWLKVMGEHTCFYKDEEIVP
ncbi:MAG: TOBE domain-containing protein [Propionivibrio sp.]